MTQKNKEIKDMILLNLNLNLHLLSILNLVYSRKGKLIRKGLPFKLRKKRMNIMRGRGKILNQKYLVTEAPVDKKVKISSMKNKLTSEASNMTEMRKEGPHANLIRTLDKGNDYSKLL